MDMVLLSEACVRIEMLLPLGLLAAAAVTVEQRCPLPACPPLLSPTPRPPPLLPPLSSVSPFVPIVPPDLPPLPPASLSPHRLLRLSPPPLPLPLRLRLPRPLPPLEFLASLSAARPRFTITVLSPIAPLVGLHTPDSASATDHCSSPLPLLVWVTAQPEPASDTDSRAALRWRGRRSERAGRGRTDLHRHPATTHTRTLTN